MEMIIFSINPIGTCVYFALFIGIFAVIGTVVYLLLTKPRMIRAEFRGLFHPVSKKSAKICAAIVMLPLILYLYWDCWNYYYTLSLQDKKLLVKYLFPNREYRITDLDNLKIVPETEARKGMAYRIKLVTAGQSFTSQQMPRKEFEENRQALTQAIQKQIDLTRGVDADAAKPAAQVTP
jgi:hypothetical protein